MKKLILILTLIPLISFGQEEKTINLNVKKGKVDDTGVTYLGNGKYSMKTVAYRYASSRSATKKVIKQVVDFANNLSDFKDAKIFMHSTSKDNNNLDTQHYVAEPIATAAGVGSRTSYTPNDIQKTIASRSAKNTELDSGVKINMIILNIIMNLT